MRELQAVVISAVARVEVPGALWRKHRAGELTLEQLASLVEEFEWDCYERFSMIAIDAPVLGIAARAVARHPLRAYDAVQLACAQAAREADPEVDLFATFDRGLATAAATEGFTVL